MSNRITLILIALLVVASFTLSLILSGGMSESMATHWNAQGQVDGYSSRNFALYFLPILQLGIGLLLFFIPNIDPRRANILKFRPVYNTAVVVIMAFFTYIHKLTLFWNLGWSFNLTAWMIPGMAGLFFFMGILLKQAQPNWFIGIRTPWTLSDNTVWDKTHKAGSIAFKACAVFSLIGIAFPEQSIFFILIPILAVAFGLVLYSFILYRRLHSEG
jgi:uncharacterized membrane protein